MAGEINRRIVLAARPTGAPRDADFRLEQAPQPGAGQGQMVCRTIWLSLDPYMRGRMNDAPSYAPPVALGGVMEGGTVGRVIESKLQGFAVGDYVLDRGGWQEYWTSDGRGVRKLDPAAAPLSTALGVLGMPGLTAYVGLAEIGRPKPGETLVVAAASGAVGSVVGQIAKQRGCRAVGIAGGPEKCRSVVEDLGFDACIDHRAPDLSGKLEAACPKGIDIYFETVGGKVFEAVFGLLNDFARIVVCGLIAQYNAASPPAGPDTLPRLMWAVLRKRLTLRGFIVSDFREREADFLREVGRWVAEGKLRYREDVVEGLENAPRGLIGLLEGRNFGKLLVRVSPDPTR